METNCHLEYLKKIKFDKHLKKLEKKLKGKTIIIYGAGIFFQTIKENFDLSYLNIIAISDKKFIKHDKDEEFLGYKVCSPDEIKELNPDYVAAGTLKIVNIIEELEETVLNDTKIKVIPLIKKPFKDIWTEIWG